MSRKYLNKETFKCIVEHTPLVSIDFIIKKGNKYLLGKRVNKPAKGYYFTIGGRIFKNETIKEAQKRILKEELNLSLTPYPLLLQFIGIFEHFYETSIFGDNISTHYINLAYLLEVKELSNLPKNQHSEYKWFSVDEILRKDNIHTYVKDYFIKTINKGKK